jgi:transposase-like protein
MAQDERAISEGGRDQPGDATGDFRHRFVRPHDGVGLSIGDSEASVFWTEFLRSLVRRGLKGVKLVVSDAHEGLKAAIQKVLNGSTWQRCRVHTTRNLLARVPKAQQSRLAALLREAFTAPNAEKAHAAWCAVADAAGVSHPKLLEAMDEAENDVLACMNFPAAHRAPPHSFLRAVLQARAS